MHAEQIAPSKNLVSVMLLLCFIPGLEVECFLLKMYKNSINDHMKK